MCHGKEEKQTSAHDKGGAGAVYRKDKVSFRAWHRDRRAGVSDAIVSKSSDRPAHLQGFSLVSQVHGANPPGGAFQAVDLDDVVLPTALVPGLADAPEAAGDLLPEEEEGFPIDLAGAAVGHAPGHVDVRQVPQVLGDGLGHQGAQGEAGAFCLSSGTQARSTSSNLSSSTGLEM